MFLCFYVFIFFLLCVSFFLFFVTNLQFLYSKVMFAQTRKKCSKDIKSSKRKKKSITENEELMYEFIHEHYELDINLETVRCPGHSTCDFACHFILDKTGEISGDLPKIARIYVKDIIWTTNNFRFWCDRRPTRKWWILSTKWKSFKISTFSEIDYIKINGKSIYCIAPISNIFTIKPIIAVCNDMAFEERLLTVGTYTSIIFLLYFYYISTTFLVYFYYISIIFLLYFYYIYIYKQENGPIDFIQIFFLH